MDIYFIKIQNIGYKISRFINLFFNFTNVLIMEATMSNISFRLYNLFRNTMKIEDVQAQEASSAFQDVMQDILKSDAKNFATSEQIVNLGSQISQLEIRMLSKMNDQIKWILGIGLTGFIFIVGLVLGLYFKK
jgi:hypothetical protein